MPSETMKAGPELDARLCRLLEPKPTARSQFWQQQVFDWKPIRVSTDGTAMVKAAEELIAKGYSIAIRRSALDPWKAWIVELSSHWARNEWGWKGGHIHADTLPHAFALAACEALEGRVEADKDDS